MTPAPREGFSADDDVLWHTAGKGDDYDPAAFDALATDVTPRTGALPVPVDWAALFKRDRKTEDWLVDDLWPRGRLISLTAPRKGRKSLLMLYLAASLAGCRCPWTGRPRTAVDVIYLDHEMNEDDLLERVEDMGFDADALTRLHYFVHPPMPMLDMPEGGRVLLELVDVHAAGAVVIDTFSRVVTSKDNTGHEVREFYRWSAGHLKARGVSLARLDHTGHSNPNRPAGTSAKGNDVDVGWVLTPGDPGAMSLRHEGLSRLGWVPERVDLLMRSDPLAFGRAARLWVPGTADCAHDLDTLGAPVDITANDAQRLLRDAGMGRQRRVVQHAVAWRREPGNHPANGPTTPSREPSSEPVTANGDRAGTEPPREPPGTAPSANPEPPTVSRREPVGFRGLDGATGRRAAVNDIERQVRAMTRPERRAHLLAAGWTHIGRDTWLHPTRDLADGDRGFYTLAAAIRTALTPEETP